MGYSKMLKWKIFRTFLCAFLVIASVFPVVSAQELVLNYDDFYNRIKRSKKSDYDNTKLGVFLKNAKTGQNCQIMKANVKLDEQVISVMVAADDELVLPYEQKLRDGKAKLLVSVADQATCDLSFQIMAKIIEVNGYKTQEILKQIVEFDRFLGDRAGYFGRLNLPKTIGIQLIFAEDTTVYTQSGKLFKQGAKVSITQDEINNQQFKGIQFARTPLRVIPLTEI